ncbi:MAG: 3'(2'),5'-bisphosphate nucleotidase CysQ family protein [Polyangiales bacterium]
MKREIEVAREAARLGAEAVMSVYGAPFDVSFKDEAKDDPVTAADTRSNAAILQVLRAAFPNDAIVTEESPPDEYQSAERCWFVDPLDGTKELVARNGEFCVMIGLAIRGQAKLGVVSVPVFGYTMIGTPDQCTLIGAERATMEGEPPAIVTSRSRRSEKLDAIFRALGPVREVPCGSVGVKIAQILLGKAQGYVHAPSGGLGPKLWDLCAPDAIARSAGLLFTDADGNDVDYRNPRLAHTTGIVVGAPALHARLLDAIRRAT